MKACRVFNNPAFWGVAALLVAQTSCSTAGLQSPPRVELASVPLGAEVRTPGGEKLGVTPLVIEGDPLKKLSKDGRLDLVISAPGHMEREIIVDLHGKDSHEIRLTRFEPEYFSERLLHDYPAEANALARGLAEIQSLIYAKKLEQASRSLEVFQKRFPNIAASYVLQASIESLKGNKDLAKRWLLRARTMDPTDPVAARMLGGKATGPITALQPTPGKTPVAAKAPTQAPVPARAPASVPPTAPGGKP